MEQGSDRADEPKERTGMAWGGAREGGTWRHPWVADPRGSGTLRVRAVGRQVRGQRRGGDEVVRRCQPGRPLGSPAVPKDGAGAGWSEG